MELCIVPFSPEYSIEFFRCTERFCDRCFSEKLGYATPLKNGAPVISHDQPKCEIHARPMFISSMAGRRAAARYVCPEPDCHRTHVKRLVA
jgi:hypothetical protein